MTFNEPDTRTRRGIFARFVADNLHTRAKGDSIIPARSRYGAGLLYDVVMSIKSDIELVMAYDRNALGLPRARPMLRIYKESIEDKWVAIMLRWCGYRCEEDKEDKDRPWSDVRPILGLVLIQYRTVLRLTITSFPVDTNLNERSQSFNLPLRYSDPRLVPTLTHMCDFVMSVIDDECKQNPSVALRQMIETRSNKTFMCGPCHKCGSRSHMFL